MNPQDHSSSARSFFQRRGGFSLIEVSIAIAVVAVAVVTLMALIPAGMGQFQAAMDSTLSAQIAQRVITDAEQADFDKLVPSTGGSGFYVLPYRYFDAQGLEVVAANPGNPSQQDRVRIVYQVRVRGSFPGSGDGTAEASTFTSIPGSPRFNPRASTFLTVQVAHNPLLRVLETDKELWKNKAAPMHTFSAVITRNGFKRPTP